MSRPLARVLYWERRGQTTLPSWRGQDGHTLQASCVRSARTTRRRARGAMTGRSGVKRFDHFAMALVDHAALELECRGQLAGVDGQLTREQRHLLDRLVTR